MTVIIKQKNNLNTRQYDGVTNIAYSSGNYVITRADATTVSYAASDYFIMIMP